MRTSPGASAEAELILACARARVDEGIAARIRAALDRGPDWQVVLRTAELQKITPLLHSNVTRVAPQQVPAHVAEELRRRTRQIRLRNLAFVGELRRILRLFQERGTAVLPFKGPALAVAAYGNLTLRQFGDLDILVHEADVGKAREALATLGYRLDTQERDWEYHFVDEQRQLTVDLHQRLASRYFPSPGDFESLHARRRAVQVGGEEVATLSQVDELLLLCIHLAKDCREWKETLSEVCDVAELVESPEFDGDRLMAHAIRIGSARLVLIALWLARELLGARVPPGATGLLARDRTAARLAAEVRRRILEQLDGSLDYVKYRAAVWRQDSRFHLLARERLPDKVQYVRYYAADRLRLLMAPSERDRSFTRLPTALGFLYYLIRPVRVARDHVHARNRVPRSGPLPQPENRGYAADRAVSAVSRES